MARRLRFHPLVADDISAAIDWYEGRSVPLGNRSEEMASSSKQLVTARPFSQPLTTSLAAGAGLLVLCDPRSARAYAANDRRNIAVFGAGGIGAANIGNMSSPHIVARADVHESRAPRRCEKHPQANRYTDFRRKLDQRDRQSGAVVVTTPDHTHAVAVLDALRRKKHVFCEKPVSRTVAEARRLREAAREQGVVTRMGNQGSASKGLRRAVELVNAAVLIGEPFDYDTLHGPILAPPEANQHLNRDYRDGWSL